VAAAVARTSATQQMGPFQRPVTEEQQVVPVALPLHLLLRDEAQRGGVHAVAAAGRSRSVVEDVPEVRVGVAAAHFDARGEEAPVLPLDDQPGSSGFEKLGHPVPESYLSRDEKSGSPETTST